MAAAGPPAGKSPFRKSGTRASARPTTRKRIQAAQARTRRRRRASERSILWIDSRLSMTAPRRALPSLVSVSGTSPAEDRPASHHEVGILRVIEDRCLAWSHGPLGVVEAQTDPAFATRNQGRHGGR